MPGELYGFEGKICQKGLTTVKELMPSEDIPKTRKSISAISLGMRIGE